MKLRNRKWKILKHFVRKISPFSVYAYKQFISSKLRRNKSMIIILIIQTWLLWLENNTRLLEKVDGKISSFTFFIGSKVMWRIFSALSMIVINFWNPIYFVENTFWYFTIFLLGAFLSLSSLFTVWRRKDRKKWFLRHRRTRRRRKRSVKPLHHISPWKCFNNT